VEEEGELLLLAPQYIAVDPLSVIFSMIVDCCLALFFFKIINFTF
jgi:hypothetical protein